MPLDGGPVQRVTSSPAQEAIAAWSPDGNRLAYCIFTGRGGIWTVRRVDGAWQQPVERLGYGIFPDVVSRWPEYLLLHGIGRGIALGDAGRLGPTPAARGHGRAASVARRRRIMVERGRAFHHHQKS